VIGVHDARVPLLAFFLVAALAVVVVPARAAADGGSAWRPPLTGATVRAGFSFDPAAPYARGARRGVDLRGTPGAPVRAVCAGTVAYAGRVPAWGPGVSIRCGGGLVATELGLGAGLAVRRGGHATAGALLGRLGSRGVLRLGARRAASRHGYVDPLALLGADPPAAGAPVVAPPAAPLRERPRPAAPHAFSPPAAGPVPVTLPWPAWAGLGLLAVGAGGGAVARRRRRRPSATRIALGHRYR
jgi:hypothetical protein